MPTQAQSRLAPLRQPVTAPAPQRRHTPIMTSDGVTLHYRDWGKGEPMLFVASASVSGAMWQYQMAAFCGSNRCIAYDRRGHGQSDDAGGGYDYDTLADDLAAVIDTLGLDDLTLVGHSMGCCEILRYLTRHGDARIRRVVLLAPMSPFLGQTGDNPDGIDPAAVDRVRDGWRHDYPRWVDENTESFFNADVSAGMKRWMADLLPQTSLQAVLECNTAIIETDMRPELPAITTPTLILHGDHDVSAPLELTGRRTAALLPNAELKVYAGAAHGIFITHLDAVNADIAAFMAR